MCSIAIQFFWQEENLVESKKKNNLLKMLLSYNIIALSEKLSEKMF